MIKYTDTRVSKIAIAVFIGGLSLASPAHADGSSPSGSITKHHNDRDRVEQRIKTMHDKLKLTPAQEPQWKDVAKVMRENESDIHKLVQDRHENEPANAIEDLESYETIADAHADGLKKLVPVFESFYKNLSTEQQARADGMFGKFEGRSTLHAVNSSNTK